MQSVEDFLNEQHHYTPETKAAYRSIIRGFESAANAPFASVYLNGLVIHQALAELEKRLKPTTWNSWLARYRRFAKWLNNGKLPDVWNISFKAVDEDELLRDKWFDENLLSG